MLSLWQLRGKVGQVFEPTGTRWWNKHTEAVTCGFSRTFTLPISSSCLSLLSLHLLPPPHSASLLPPRPWCHWAVRRHVAASPVPAELWKEFGGDGINETCARSHISLWRGETCCWGVNYSDSKYHSSHHAKTSDKKPPAISGLHTSLAGYTNQPTPYQWKKHLLPREKPQHHASVFFHWFDMEISADICKHKTITLVCCKDAMQLFLTP